MVGKIEFKFISGVANMEKVIPLQERTWGKNTVTVLPHLIAAVHNGGMVIGAYDEAELVGFVYGFPGYKDKVNFLVSHMMAVLPNYRNDGIGEKLKHEQRKWAQQNGYTKIRWTYDSLESRNGYLNLHKLKGYVHTYIRAYYGELKDDINNGLPSDRFEVEWDITDDRVKETSYPPSITKLVEGKSESGIVTPMVNKLALEEDLYLVAVPANIHELKSTSIDMSMKWRFAHRQAFEKLFAHNYMVMDLIQGSTEDGINYYVASKK
ncbi:MAG: GNAT family N-acetyltransferase [Bacillus sp. (in: Bacteria)]|nr:GNAT family N-acetyltransferase [Bacillus sp. (in: firmicutes)]